MPLYSMPVIFIIDAENPQEAEQVLEDWNDELELELMPVGCENVIHNPDCEISEENKILYLPLDSDSDDEQTESVITDDDSYDDDEEV